MDSVKITLEIVDGIEKTLELGYTKVYVNVDDLEDGNGFLRVLAMQESKDMIIFEGIFTLNICFEVLMLLDQSKYKIKDFTNGGD